MRARLQGLRMHEFPGTWPARDTGSMGSGNQLKSSGEKTKVMTIRLLIDLMPTVKTEEIWIGH